MMPIGYESREWFRAGLRCVPGELGCWLRRKLYGFKAGTGTRILAHIIVYYSENLTIGENVGINAIGGQRMLTVHTPANRTDMGDIENACVVNCSIDQLPLASGEYSVKIALTELRGGNWMISKMSSRLLSLTAMRSVKAAAFPEACALHRVSGGGNRLTFPGRSISSTAIAVVAL